MTDNQATQIQGSFWPRGISWLTIVFALLAIVTFVAVSRSGARYDTLPMATGGGVMEYSGSSGEAVPYSAEGVPMRDSGVSSAPSQGKVNSDMYYPYPYQNPD